MLCVNKCWFICGRSPRVLMMPICLLLNMSHFPARQLVYLIPRVYNCSVPSSFLDDFADLAQLCKGSQFPLPASSKNIASLPSAKGEEFVHFAKSERFVDGKESISFHSYFHFIHFFPFPYIPSSLRAVFAADFFRQFESQCSPIVLILGLLVLKLFNSIK